MENRIEPAERQGVQVIARAFAVLRALEAEPQGLSLGDIAESTGLARSTVQRIVDALAAEQMLIAATLKTRVRLGPGLLRLAASASDHMDLSLRSFLEELSREVGETVDLSMLQGRSAVFLDQITGGQRLVAVSAVGESFPLHCTANGKALMASLPVDAQSRMVNATLKAHTANSIVSGRKLKAAIEEYRRTNLAWDEEEHSEGICAVGTAFSDPIGRAFAISIPVPTVRFAKKRQQLSKSLLAVRERIVAHLAA